MNPQRLIVLGFALVAAGGAAFLVRGMLGGGTPVVQAKQAPAIAMSEVLVASTNLSPGQALTAEQVRWEKWPSSTIDPSFIIQEPSVSEDQLVKGSVVRAVILPGQPITKTAIVKGDASGFMAATLGEGMRAVSIAISSDSGAGGFILPNDRVDVILTRKGQGNSTRGFAKTILSNLRVLAVDQTYRQEKDTRTVVGKTATVEVAPEQAEVISAAGMSGQLSLALRPLSETDDANLGAKAHKRVAVSDGNVSVIRYGLAGSNQQESPQ
jgi:pilus assembly protein CpaB